MSEQVQQSPAEQSETSSRENMIEAIGLSKFYGQFAATKDVTFSVPRGQVAAFLGPNGAGKSTTMKLLTGFLSPSEGQARVGGYDVSTHRIEASQKLGYLPENGPLYEEMTPQGFLTYAGRVRGMSTAELRNRLEFVMDKCDLSSVWNKPIRKLSRGFRQRVGMAQALLHDPDILILDEPTSGLDPNQNQSVRDLIRDLGKTKTILLSTHILQEVKAVCSRVILINQGSIVFDGSVNELGNSQDDMEASFHKMTHA
ncbi:MAG: ABC transporter ATP-binding protein [Planctomycetaceae bacterium]|nr:ABC transporter ATP-binding protein [Planctomycetaceae bacterium]MCA9021608.1 ABC transporter ATP-binding protein [Planctomycetaceae bacterium]